MKVSAVIPAAGSGQRMQNNIAKQFIRIGAKPILFYTLFQFENCEIVDEIVLVVKEEEIQFTREKIVNAFGIHKVKYIVAGGLERQSSVFAGLQSLVNNTDYVIIHDGVRPFIPLDLIEDSVRLCVNHGAVITAIPISSTVKLVDDYKVKKTINRSNLWDVQTPQVFNFQLIYSAYKEALEDGFFATDDSMIVERQNIPVKVIEGSKQNIKITTQEDLDFARYLLEKKQ